MDGTGERAPQARASVRKRMAHVVLFDQYVQRVLNDIQDLQELKGILKEIRELIPQVYSLLWKTSANARWRHPEVVRDPLNGNGELSKAANACLRVLYMPSTLDGMSKILENARERCKVALALERKVRPKRVKRTTSETSSDQ